MASRQPGGTRRAALAALLCGLAAGPSAAAGSERLVDAAARQDTRAIRALLHAGIDVARRRPDTRLGVPGTVQERADRAVADTQVP